MRTKFELVIKKLVFWLISLVWNFEQKEKFLEECGHLFPPAQTRRVKASLRRGLRNNQAEMQKRFTVILLSSGQFVANREERKIIWEDYMKCNPQMNEGFLLQILKIPINLDLVPQIADFAHQNVVRKDGGALGDELLDLLVTLCPSGCESASLRAFALEWLHRKGTDRQSLQTVENSFRGLGYLKNESVAHSLTHVKE